MTGSLDLNEIVAGAGRRLLALEPVPRAMPMLPLAFLMLLIAGLAEINVTPFDIMEAESELVAGFNTEYSGMKFALFFLAEFAASFTLAAIIVTLFLGGYQPPLHVLGGQTAIGYRAVLAGLAVLVHGEVLGGGAGDNVDSLHAAARENGPAYEPELEGADPGGAGQSAAHRRLCRVLDA